MVTYLIMAEEKIKNLHNFFFESVIDILLVQKCTNIKAFEIENGISVKLECSKNFDKNKIKFVSYSNKLKPEIETIQKKFNVKSFTRMKSSLKFCVIAAGEYDGYIAEPRAYEWDIAAGHAILEHSGGLVTDFDNNEIIYGKKDFKNSSLILRNKKIL